MTREELEQKAEEYAENPSKLLLSSLCCGSDLPENDCTLEEIAEPIEQAFKDGYKQAFSEIEVHNLTTELKVQIEKTYKTIRTNALSDYSSFENCIKSMFGEELADKISKSIQTSPKDLIQNRIEVSFDDLLTIWDAGIHHYSAYLKRKEIKH